MESKWVGILGHQGCYTGWLPGVLPRVRAHGPWLEHGPPTGTAACRGARMAHTSEMSEILVIAGVKPCPGPHSLPGTPRPAALTCLHTHGWEGTASAITPLPRGPLPACWRFLALQPLPAPTRALS